MRLLDYRAIIHQYYRIFENEVGEYFTKELLPPHDQVRLQGYNNAMIWWIATEAEAGDGATLERWRLDNMQVAKNNIERIKRLKHTCTIVLLFVRGLVTLGTYSFFFALGFFVYLLATSMGVKSFLILLLPLAIFLFASIFWVVSYLIIMQQLESSFYYYGFAERVMHLSDRHNVLGEADLSPLSRRF